MTRKIRIPASTRRKLFKVIGEDALALRYDWPRRFRNALLCLALSDPGWMDWIERHLPRRITDAQRAARAIEPRARYLVLKNYSFHGRACIGFQIFCDRPFNDDGDLTPG